LCVNPSYCRISAQNNLNLHGQIGISMKRKINWLLIIALIALVFCVSYLVSHLIIKKLYIDAAFVVAIVVLFPLLVYSVRRGN